MPTFSNIDGEESATVTFTVGAVSLTRNSSAELQEILCLGDPDVESSLGVARVTASPPASSNAGLNVRILSGPSSVADFSVRAVLPSTVTDNLVRALTPSTYADAGIVRAQNSSAPDLLTRPIAPSTYGDGGIYRVAQSTAGDLIATVKNSTIGDLLASVQQNSTVWAVQIPSSQSVQVKNSTIGDLLASVQQNSTTWFAQAAIRDSSGTGFVGTTLRPTTGAQGLVVRTVLNDLQSTCLSSMGNNSTSSTIVSSAASVRHKVYAYSITSTAQAVNTLSFASSLGNPIWQVQMQSVSSGITGANLAVTPPAWLFATEAASPLVFKITGTTGTYHLSFSYFSEA